MSEVNMIASPETEGTQGQPDDPFEIIKDSDIMDAKEETHKVSNEDVVSAVSKEAKEIQDALERLGADPSLVELLGGLDREFSHWTEIRRATISNLRAIADYIESVSRKSGVAKMIGSGGGVLAGGLTIIGGALTIASMGAAFPLLVAGTSLGLASGVAGGTAAVTEKIIKSRQMKEAQKAIDEDEKATAHLEERVTKIKESKVFEKIASDLMMTGGGAAYDSLAIVRLVADKGIVGSFTAGIQTVAQLFGEDVSKEVSKILLHTSTRALAGSVTVVFGGVTMLYDIYKLNGELRNMAEQGAVKELRTIADELEKALCDMCQGEQKDETKGEPNEEETGDNRDEEES